MAPATVRIPARKRDVLKVIANIEKREMKEILDQYTARHKETPDILSKPKWADMIDKGNLWMNWKIESKPKCH